MPESNKKSANALEHLDWINDQLTIMAEAFGEKLTEERQEIYCAGLAEFPQNRLDTAFRRARYELKWFPKLAELRGFAGVVPGGPNDGRPGPEEAWARMPKGERLEEDSIVWCEEERSAYSACRSLLLEGDLIGARMAFKERYEKELAAARSLGVPARWAVSAGYDVESRLTTLASGVEENRISVEYALNFVPGHRQDDFARMLPPARTIGLLTGTVARAVNLPGFPGLLAKMQMQELLPDELKAAEPSPSAAAPMSPDERRNRLKELKRQVEFLKRSRNGPADDTA